jgi:Copper binding proteins, plastocyanin/azurin family
MRLICTLLAAGAVALLATSPAAPMSHPRLIGTVGPGFTITLKQNGKALKTLKAGTYTFVVSDKASIHNFQIEGPGLDRAITTVGATGTKTVTLRLKHGTYKYYCAPHESTMHGSFKVT